MGSCGRYNNNIPQGFCTQHSEPHTAVLCHQFRGISPISKVLESSPALTCFAIATAIKAGSLCACDIFQGRVYSPRLLPVWNIKEQRKRWGKTSAQQPPNNRQAAELCSACWPAEKGSIPLDARWICVATVNSGTL